MSDITCPSCGGDAVVTVGAVAEREGKPRALGLLGRRRRYVAPLKCEECGLRWVEDVPRGFTTSP